MKKLLAVALCLSALTLSSCSSYRGTVGDQKVCENEYFLGVISISELIAPCKK